MQGHCHWARERKYSRNSIAAASHHVSPALFSATFCNCSYRTSSTLSALQRVCVRHHLRWVQPGLYYIRHLVGPRTNPFPYHPLHMFCLRSPNLAHNQHLENLEQSRRKVSHCSGTIFTCENNEKRHKANIHSGFGSSSVNGSGSGSSSSGGDWC